MCSPATLAGLALSAGGTYLQSREADKNAKAVANAKNDAFTADMIRQRGYADQAGAAFNQNISNQGKDNFDQRKDLETDKMKQAFAERRVQPDYNVGLTSNAPKNVVLSRKGASDEATAETDRDVNNLAGLQGYSGAMFNQDLDRNQFARAFGNIQDTASTDARLLPLRINAAANNAQRMPSAFPTLLRTAGQGLSLFGGAGGSFSNTVPGQMASGVFGPGAPVTQYGLFMDGKPLQAFGHDLARRV